jgi:polysaccharide export outer membrane protein
MSGSRTSGFCTVAAVLAAVAAAGCGHRRDTFMWVDAVPKSMSAPRSQYQIAPGDVIGVRVFNQEANSVDRIRVRDDGKISLPFLNDVDAAGAEPSELARRIEVKLKAFLTSPVVTVVVHDRRPLRISVVGKVVRPGVYDVEWGSGVIHGLAAAGGLTPFADDDGVFVLRSGYWADGHVEPARIRFRYRDLQSGKAPASIFLLRPGDVIVVE